ncbi:hypothetical protein DMN50_04985, partial [Priestia megaterium]
MKNELIDLPVIVTKQGKRITYLTNMTFREVSMLLNHTTTKPNKPKSVLSDTESLRNRYLKPDKVKEIEQYIHRNFEEFILPPITVVARSLFPIENIAVPENSLIENNHLNTPTHINEHLDNHGLITGYISIDSASFNGEILDGNHRAAAVKTIHELIGEDLPGFRIGVQFYHETNDNKIRQSFVDLNTSTPIDKAILTLFSKRDTLSIAAKEIIGMGENKSFVVPELNEDSERFIGFDYINDAVTRNSKAVLSLNMVKNMLLRFAVGDNGSIKKFEQTYHLDTLEYALLLKRFSTYMKAIFQNVEPFETIVQSGVETIPELRKQYISLTGAGLY